jgi:hypothetical protein
MKSRQSTDKTRQQVPRTKHKVVRRAAASRRVPVVERAHLSCLLCGRKGDVDVPVGTLLVDAPHELICTDCVARHPAAPDHASGTNHSAFKIIGRDGDSPRVLVVHTLWDPADRRRGLAPSWIFDTKLKKGWGPLPLLAATRSGGWREWSPDDRETRKWLSGFAAVRKDMRPATPEPQPALPAPRVSAPSKARRAQPAAPRTRTR